MAGVSQQVAVVIPSYGDTNLTKALVGDLLPEAELVDVFVVDNGGDYEPTAEETVIRPGENLGWLRGCNRGLQEANAAASYAHYVLLNNDTRLSRGFIGGLVKAQAATGAGLVGPRYDGAWWAQRVRKKVAASEWRPSAKHRTANFVDGTCMLIPAGTLDSVGLLDEQHFGSTGWGADIDYAIRVRALGLDVVISDLSFLSHAEAASAAGVFDDYGGAGREDMRKGLSAKYGSEWQRAAGVTPPLSLAAIRLVRRVGSRGKRTLGLSRGPRGR